MGCCLLGSFSKYDSVGRYLTTAWHFVMAKSIWSDKTKLLGPRSMW